MVFSLKAMDPPGSLPLMACPWVGLGGGLLLSLLSHKER